MILVGNGKELWQQSIHHRIILNQLTAEVHWAYKLLYNFIQVLKVDLSHNSALLTLNESISSGTFATKLATADISRNLSIFELKWRKKQSVKVANWIRAVRLHRSNMILAISELETNTCLNVKSEFKLLVSQNPGLLFGSKSESYVRKLQIDKFSHSSSF